MPLALRTKHTGHSYGEAGKALPTQACSPEPRSLVPKVSHTAVHTVALPACPHEGVGTGEH